MAVKRLGLPEELADAIRQRILNGEFKEGDQLVQEALAQEYGVSRMPVRDALRQLEAGGLVAIRLNRGATVTTVPTEQISELFELRATLESGLLEYAIPRMRDEDLARARAFLPELEAAYREQDIARFAECNSSFHRALYMPSARAQTLSIVHAINLQIDRYIRLHLLLTGAEQAEEDHRELMRLCASRDVDRAVPFLRRHILEAGRSLLRTIEDRRSGTR